ncbi:MAG: hypothetical protein ABTR07_15140 [Candidatus Competibacter denitrificans]
MKNSKPLLLATLGAVGSIASIISLSGWQQTLCLVLLAASMIGAIGYELGRDHRSSRDAVLDLLGFTRAYETAKEDDALLSSKIRNARKVRIIAVNAEMLFRNLPGPFKDAFKRGIHLEVLVCDPNAQLVTDMEKMELDDGREKGRSIQQCIRETEPTLNGLLVETATELAAIDQHKLGQVYIGYFTSQYRETMIICDEDWIWWTPHLNPARGADRPTFVIEGASSKYVRMCIHHFEAVKRMTPLKRVSGARRYAA